jgi:hypothetical protein
MVAYFGVKKNILVRNQAGDGAVDRVGIKLKSISNAPVSSVV